MNRITRFVGAGLSRPVSGQGDPAPTWIPKKALLIIAGICGAVVMWAMIILFYAGFEMLAWTGGR